MRERKRDRSSKLKRGAVVTCQTLSFRVDCSETSFTRTTNKELFIGGFLYHVNLINDYGLIMLVKPMRKQEAVAFEQWEQAQDTVHSCVHFCVRPCLTFERVPLFSLFPLFRFCCGPIRTHPCSASFYKGSF